MGSLGKEVGKQNLIMCSLLSVMPGELRKELADVGKTEREEKVQKLGDFWAWDRQLF